MKRIQSNGKFLITGEYLVLAGAKAFAVPLKSGQIMDVETGYAKPEIHWEVKDTDGRWFYVTLDLSKLQIIETDHQPQAEFLVHALQAARDLNPSFLKSDTGYLVSNQLEFKHQWGMGSSSSFLANLAKWSGVNPFDLHRRLSEGSGFDIACAYADTPIIFQRSFDQTQIESVKWSPPFRNNLAFVYLGKKQNSEKSIANFKELDITDQHIRQANKIAEEFWLINDPVDLMEKMWEHEEMISAIIKIQPVQDKLFRDFNGAIKSLGAWGGDFVLAAGKDKFSKIRKYFTSKGYETVLPWDIVLQ